MLSRLASTDFGIACIGPLTCTLPATTLPGMDGATAAYRQEGAKEECRVVKIAKTSSPETARRPSLAAVASP